MNLFQSVKENVTTFQAAENYGFDVKRNGMICCPFHDDSTPSMKVDKRYHCFGCGEDGDVINFVQKLFDLSPKKAAQKLAYDFGISYDNSEKYKTDKQSIIKRIETEKYRNAENRVFRAFCDYFHLLKNWRSEFAPKKPEDAPNPLFIESLTKLDYVEHILDVLSTGSAKEKANIISENAKEVSELERRIAGFKFRAERTVGTGNRCIGDDQIIS